MHSDRVLQVKQREESFINGRMSAATTTIMAKPSKPETSKSNRAPKERAPRIEIANISATQSHAKAVLARKRAIADMLEQTGMKKYEKGDLAGALKESLLALMQRRGVAALYSNLEKYYKGKRDIQLKVGDTSGAAGYEEKVRSLGSKMVDDLWSLASSYTKVGWILFEMNMLQGAVERYRSAIAIQEKLGSKSSALASMYGTLGNILLKQGKEQEAEIECTKAKSILQALDAGLSEDSSTSVSKSLSGSGQDDDVVFLGCVKPVHASRTVKSSAASAPRQRGRASLLVRRHKPIAKSDASGLSDFSHLEDTQRERSRVKTVCHQQKTAHKDPQGHTREIVKLFERLQENCGPTYAESERAVVTSESGDSNQKVSELKPEVESRCQESAKGEPLAVKYRKALRMTDFRDFIDRSSFADAAGTEPAHESNGVTLPKRPLPADRISTPKDEIFKPRYSRLVARRPKTSVAPSRERKARKRKVADVSSISAHDSPPKRIPPALQGDRSEARLKESIIHDAASSTFRKEEYRSPTPNGSLAERHYLNLVARRQPVHHVSPKDRAAFPRNSPPSRKASVLRDEDSGKVRPSSPVIHGGLVAPSGRRVPKMDETQPPRHTKQRKLRSNDQLHASVPKHSSLVAAPRRKASSSDISSKKPSSDARQASTPPERSRNGKTGQDVRSSGSKPIIHDLIVLSVGLPPKKRVFQQRA